nr:pilus assembly protein TadG-related protein [Roseibaca sp. Y0-43]
MAAFRRAQDGAITTIAVVLLPMILFAGGVAVDLSRLNAQKRHVQSQAELAALSAALNHGAKTDKVRAAWRTVSSTAQHDLFDFGDANVILGTLGADGFRPIPDQSDLYSANAVRVDVGTRARLLALRMFINDDDMAIQRSAIATLEPPRVSFALSNCLLNLRLLDPILRPVLGVQTDVLCSGRGVDTRVDVLPYLDALALEANLLTPSADPLTYGQLLDMSIPASAVFSALTGNPVMNAPGEIRMGDILYLPPDLRALSVGAPLRGLSVDLSDIAFASAEILASRVADLEVGLDLGGFGTVAAALRIGDPRKIVIGAVPGDPNAVARTSQIELDLAELSIAGLFTLDLGVRVANASATLSTEGNACALVPSAEVAVFDPVDASLIDVTLSLRVLGLPGGQAALGVAVDTVESRETRRVSFTRSDYSEAPIRIIAPTGADPDQTAVDALRAGVASLLDTRADALGAETPSCTGLLGCLLGGVSDLLSGILGSLTGAVVNVANAVGAEGSLTNALLEDVVGLGIARAELELLDVRCSGFPKIAASGDARILRQAAPL